MNNTQQRPQVQEEQAKVKMPTANLEAEQALLGCLLLDASTLDKVMGIVEPHDFYRDAHRYIYEAIVSLVAEGGAVDILVLIDRLTERNQWQYIGGEVFLMNLLEFPTAASFAEHYAQIVADKAIRRKLMDAAKDIFKLAKEEARPVTDTLAEAERRIVSAGQRRVTESMTPVTPLLRERLAAYQERCARGGGINGRATGLDDLDWYTNGFQQGELILLAARPSVGKSALAVQWAMETALIEKLPAVVFSLEMSKEQVVDRMICSQSRINGGMWRKGFVPEEAFQTVIQAIDALADAPLYLDDLRSISIAEMRAKLRRVKSQRGAIGLIVVDYLQIMAPVRANGNRAQELGEVVAALKSLAREFDCPLVALSQLSRAVEQRGDKRPNLSDLKDSGSIEAEADLVMFLYREDYYKRDEPGHDPAEFVTAELIIGKHRNGALGTVRVGFHPTYGRFETLEEKREGGLDADYDPFPDEEDEAAQPEFSADLVSSLFQ